MTFNRRTRLSQVVRKDSISRQTVPSLWSGVSMLKRGCTTLLTLAHNLIATTKQPKNDERNYGENTIVIILLACYFA